MNYKYGNQTFTIRLEDDGTLDTVISVNGKSYRFDSEYARTVDGGISEDAITSAIEGYLEECEVSL